ncbi:MAG: hypothetical protein H6821_15445 [Planctomycetaceae bacterium]|nr:hypothetical protein [Planctomycetales bacterium]MCB9875566.1 hypothetical protein [Planctomycetaceae bacterium]MCB9938301.1 hypothetical protein [Planctomycetaceae bacterium]
MSEKKPTPWVSQPSGKMCPVCGTRTYSKEGIHPQCAVHQADSVRAEKLKVERKLEASVPKATTWTKKKCPKCGVESHVRRKECDCGYVFSQ